MDQEIIKLKNQAELKRVQVSQRKTASEHINRQSDLLRFYQQDLINRVLGIETEDIDYELIDPELEPLDIFTSQIY